MKKFTLKNEEILIEEFKITNDSFKLNNSFVELYFEFFKYSEKFLTDSEFFVNEFIPYLRKLFIFNLHIHFNVFIDDINNQNNIPIIELNHSSLLISNFNSIEDYFRENLTTENYFKFNFDYQNYLIEYLIIFHDFNDNSQETYFDFIISHNNIYDNKSIELINIILSNQNFQDEIFEDFGIRIKNKSNV